MFQETEEGKMTGIITGPRDYELQSQICVKDCQTVILAWTVWQLTRLSFYNNHF